MVALAFGSQKGQTMRSLRPKGEFKCFAAWQAKLIPKLDEQDREDFVLWNDVNGWLTPFMHVLSFHMLQAYLKVFIFELHDMNMS